MKRKVKDRHLDIPGEANRDKHINFLALENNDFDPADIPAEGALSPENIARDKQVKKKKQKSSTKNGNENS